MAYSTSVPPLGGPPAGPADLPPLPGEPMDGGPPPPLPKRGEVDDRGLHAPPLPRKGHTLPRKLLVLMHIHVYRAIIAGDIILGYFIGTTTCTYITSL